jgi:hypothetical protein
MWDKENNSAYMEYVNSYLKYDMSKMQNMGIDVEAELMRMVSTGLCDSQINVSDTLIMPYVKEDRRKYLLIRR